MEDRKMYIRFALIGSGIILSLVMAAWVLPKAIVTFTKAAPATIVSLSETQLIGERLLARADGKDECVVNVFVMDKLGKGVANKMVILEGVEGISPSSATTDKNGRTKFAIVSKEEGTFELGATVDGVMLDKRVKVTFRN